MNFPLTDICDHFQAYQLRVQFSAYNYQTAGQIHQFLNFKLYSREKSERSCPIILTTFECFSLAPLAWNFQRMREVKQLRDNARDAEDSISRWFASLVASSPYYSRGHLQFQNPIFLAFSYFSIGSVGDNLQQLHNSDEIKFSEKTHSVVWKDIGLKLFWSSFIGIPPIWFHNLSKTMFVTSCTFFSAPLSGFILSEKTIQSKNAQQLKRENTVLLWPSQQRSTIMNFCYLPRRDESYKKNAEFHKHWVSNVICHLS